MVLDVDNDILAALWHRRPIQICDRDVREVFSAHFDVVKSVINDDGESSGVFHNERCIEIVIREITLAHSQKQAGKSSLFLGMGEGNLSNDDRYAPLIGEYATGFTVIIYD